MDKKAYLKKTGTWNRNADKVCYELFKESDFFDPSDAVQVKYEMLRATVVEKKKKVKVCKEFGLSRVGYYKIEKAFSKQGVAGLMEKKRGRKGPDKLTEKLREYIRQLSKQVPGISGAKIAQRIEEEFGIKLHKRTVEKALKKIHLKGKSMGGERG